MMSTDLCIYLCCQCTFQHQLALESYSAIAANLYLSSDRTHLSGQDKLKLPSDHITTEVVQAFPQF